MTAELMPVEPTPYANIGTWTWSTQTGAPNAQQVRTDTGTWETPTKVNITPADATSVDHTDAIVLLKAGDTLRLAVTADISQYVTLVMAGAPVDHTTYFEIPVTFQEQAGATPTNNTNVTVTVQPVIPVGAVVKTVVTLLPNETNVLTPEIAGSMADLIVRGLQTLSHLTSHADFRIYIQGGSTMNRSYEILPATEGEVFP